MLYGIDDNSTLGLSGFVANCVCCCFRVLQVHDYIYHTQIALATMAYF